MLWGMSDDGSDCLWNSLWKFKLNQQADIGKRAPTSTLHKTRRGDRSGKSDNGNKDAMRPWSGEVRSACHGNRLFSDRCYSDRRAQLIVGPDFAGAPAVYMLKRA
jgi:hypothetical protein